MIAERLRAVDPQQFRRYRSAAWRHLQSETRALARHELARSTADVLFLIDNPVVREAFFPTTAHAHSVEASKAADADALRTLWHEHDFPESAAVLDHWLDRIPNAVRAVRDHSGTLVGCSIVASWRDIPQSLERVDPVLAGFAAHAARNPLPTGQTTVVPRRWLTTAEGGDGPSSAQAAAWLDVKRDYFSMRPHLGRVYTTLDDPTPFIEALIVLGFTTFGPAMIGSDAFHLGAPDFGYDSVDGWLSRLAAAELGIVEETFLDANDHSVAFGGRRVQLSPLEFGVLTLLARRRGNAVTRAEFLDEVWGEDYQGATTLSTSSSEVYASRPAPTPIASRRPAASATGSGRPRGKPGATRPPPRPAMSNMTLILVLDVNAQQPQPVFIRPASTRKSCLGRNRRRFRS